MVLCLLRCAPCSTCRTMTARRPRAPARPTRASAPFSPARARRCSAPRGKHVLVAQPVLSRTTTHPPPLPPTHTHQYTYTHTTMHPRERYREARDALSLMSFSVCEVAFDDLTNRLCYHACLCLDIHAHVQALLGTEKHLPCVTCSKTL